MFEISLAVAIALAAPPQLQGPTITDWQWVAVARDVDGWFVVAGKPLEEGSSYGGCFTRVVEQGGHILELHCQQALACKPGCARQSREYPDYLLVWCECGGEADGR